MQSSSTAASSRQVEHGQVRKYFHKPSTPGISGEIIDIKGWDEDQGPSIKQDAVIFDRIPGFKLCAEIGPLEAGHYTVHWRVTIHQEISIPKDLRFSAVVSYDDEPTTTGTLEAVLSHGELTGRAEGLYDVVLEESVDIQPHTGNAHVELSLVGDEPEDEAMEDSVYSGLSVVYVGIKPTGMALDCPARGDTITVERWNKPKLTLDYTQTSTSVDSSRAFPVTRLAWSKKGRFLASLALAPDTAYVTVWDMCFIGDPDPENPPNLSNLYRNGVVGVIKHPGIGALSIGLAISTSGDQVAIYQEPKIGEWTKESPLESTFRFQLFNNPLQTPFIPAETSQGSGSGGTSLPGRHIQNPNSRSGSWTGTKVLQKQDCPDALGSLVGYCAFLTPSVDSSGRNTRSFTAFGVFLARAFTFRNDSGNTSKGRPSADGLFAAYNGQYLNIFKTWPQGKWEHLHSLPLKESTPMPFRRMAWMMMDSIGSEAFMWVEEEGRCRISKLDGSSISCISSADNAEFKSSTFQGFTTMALSPDGSIVALADDKGTVTTYYTSNGAAIVDWNFPGCAIVHIGFHGNNHQLYVVTRDRSANLSCRIMDALQLTYELTGSNIPIPVGGSTIFAFFQGQGFKGQGVLCEASGGRINCYGFYSPRSTDERNATIANPTAVAQKSLLNQNVQYHLRTGIHKELFMEEGGTSNNVFWVEVVEENLAKRTQRIIFSFVPEPWVRVPTRKIASLEGLLSAYFLPCGTRFVTVGKQTIQIWSLPTTDNPRFSLQFIWSDPESAESEHEKAKIERECEYEKARVLYRDTKRASIYVDVKTGGTIAMIEMNGWKKREIVPLPSVGTANGHYAVLPCFRSIHLLAAAYAFSHSHSENTMDEAPQRRFTFGNHAGAIIQFARKFINHKAFLAKSPGPNIGIHSIEWSLDWTKVSRPPPPGHSSSEEVTILRLLLDQTDLRGINHYFVEGLLRKASGHWIPDDNPDNNPIKFAIESKNKRLLNVVIDYCTKCAKLYHPAYVSPIVQCLKELATHYPLDTADVLRKMSYIPVTKQPPTSGLSEVDYFKPKLNVNYLASHLVDTFRYDLHAEKTARNTENYDSPRFNLQTQLAGHPFIHMNRNAPLPPRRDHDFLSPTQVYVTPFLYLPTSMASFPTLFAGERVVGYIDTPVILASLRFRWYVTGFRYWILRFLAVVIFYGMVMVITAQQIRISLVKEGQSPTADEMTRQFLTEWRLEFKITIGFGIFLLLLELLQMYRSVRWYLRSLYNYVELGAFVFPIVGCFKFLNTEPGMTLTDQRFSQDWILGFGIILIHLNMLFELRVIIPLGIVVNIILKITWRIRWFLLIFGLFLVSFTHALLYMLHTQNNQPLQGNYPTGFFAALLATFFFLFGRYDPISASIENGSVGFHIMIVIFCFFTVILLLNILIALMNDEFNASVGEGRFGQLKQITEITLQCEKMFRRRGPDFYPKYIYYNATDKEVREFQSKYLVSDVSSLNAQNRYIMETSTVTGHITHLNQNAIIEDLTSMKAQQESNVQEMEELKTLMTQNHNDVKQELEQLRSLVKDLCGMVGRDRKASSATREQ